MNLYIPMYIFQLIFHSFSTSYRALVESDVHVEVGGGGGGDDKFMQTFFDDVGIIKQNMNNIKRNVAAISAKHSDSLAAVQAQDGNAISEELDGLVDETNATAAAVRDQLKLMEGSIKNFANSEGATPSEVNIRKNLHGTLARNFVELMKEYQEIQSAYKAKYHERVKRQVRIVKPDASDNDFDRALSGDTSQIFTMVTKDGRYNEAKNALADIEDKHKDILKIEQSINELHQLFLDMAVMVEAQGELLDQIEYTVGKAVGYTDKGVNELRKARKYQKASRKKMCCLIVLFLGIAIAIAFPLILTNVGSSSGEGGSTSNN